MLKLGFQWGSKIARIVMDVGGPPGVKCEENVEFFAACFVYGGARSSDEVHRPTDCESGGQEFESSPARQSFQWVGRNLRSRLFPQ